MLHKNPEDKSISDKNAMFYIYSLTQQMRQDTMCVLMTLSGLANDTSPPSSLALPSVPRPHSGKHHNTHRYWLQTRWVNVLCFVTFEMAVVTTGSGVMSCFDRVD